jgi:hypothetical protein
MDTYVDSPTGREMGQEMAYKILAYSRTQIRSEGVNLKDRQMTTPPRNSTSIAWSFLSFVDAHVPEGRLQRSKVKGKR